MLGYDIPLESCSKGSHHRAVSMVECANQTGDAVIALHIICAYLLPWNASQSLSPGLQRCSAALTTRMLYHAHKSYGIALMKCGWCYSIVSGLEQDMRSCNAYAALWLFFAVSQEPQRLCSLWHSCHANGNMADSSRLALRHLMI